MSVNATFAVLCSEMIGQVQPQEETGEAQDNKVYFTTNLRDMVTFCEGAVGRGR